MYVLEMHYACLPLVRPRQPCHLHTGHHSCREASVLALLMHKLSMRDVVRKMKLASEYYKQIV